MNHQGIESKFNLKGMKYDEQTSRLHFAKDFDDPKLAQEFENKLKEFLSTFVKDEVKIPKSVFAKVKEAIEDRKAELEAEKVEFSFDSYHVTLVGKKEDVIQQKQLAEATVDTISEQAKLQSTELIIDDENKLKFLNFTDYFKEVMDRISRSANLWDRKLVWKIVAFRNGREDDRCPTEDPSGFGEDLGD